MLHGFLVLAWTVPFVIILSLLGAMIYGAVRPERVRAARERRPVLPRFEPVLLEETAILIACHNGAATIATAVSAARADGREVYVVSDASTDGTVEVAVTAGARVLALTVNVGKPAALKAAFDHFGLATAYRAVAILDDDVVIAPDFMAESLAQLGDDVAIVVGRNVTWWPRERRWNPWLAKRAYSYWNYQAVIRRIQSHFNVMNCISGSNSVYRVELLTRVLADPPPYIVDDTFWVLETHRRGLGRVGYAPRATALLQDPTTLRDWYKQNLRWMWGTFQGIIGHRVGRQRSRFDYAYVLLMAHWLVYVLSGPLTLFLLARAGLGVSRGLLLLVAVQAIWVSVASWRLRHPRLVLFVPFIILADLIYRVVLVHALVKAVRHPTVDQCVWASPARIGSAAQN
jgi:cellulose synthase/poly-beta-1,6-N-acetylglucosamine synthase-like glycosyltransferase